MPWNPMRVEQRIGRVDRLGQKYKEIRIINLHYKDTVEADVYNALRTRIKLFENVVGGLQPILSNMSKLITEQVLEGQKGCQIMGLPEEMPANSTIADQIIGDIDKLEGEKPFDINETTDDTLEEFLQEEEPILTMEDLDRVIAHKALLPPQISMTPLDEQNREYTFSAPGLPKSVRVTTNPEFYEQHAESVELWSPGNPTFPYPSDMPLFDEAETPSEFTKLADVLNQIP